MKAEKGILLQLIPHVYSKNQAKNNDDMIGCVVVVLVSILCSRHCFIALSSWLYDLWTYIQQTIASCTIGIYSVDTFLYSYTLLIDSILYTFSSFCLSCNLSQAQDHNIKTVFITSSQLSSYCQSCKAQIQVFSNIFSFSLYFLFNLFSIFGTRIRVQHDITVTSQLQ